MRPAILLLFGLCITIGSSQDEEASTPAPEQLTTLQPLVEEDIDKVFKAHVAIRKEEKLTAAQNQNPSDNDIENWQVPSELERAYPYYLSGYDEENRPIWISEFGKFKITQLISQGPEKTLEFEKYVAKALGRVMKSITARNKDGSQLVAIIDFEGLSFGVFSQIPTLRLLLKLARDYRKVLEESVHYAIVINASYPAERLINLVRPLLGRLLENVEVYGENKNKWLPEILRRMPKDQLPEWYGGVKEHVPLKVYG